MCRVPTCGRTSCQSTCRSVPSALSALMLWRRHVIPSCPLVPLDTGGPHCPWALKHMAGSLPVTLEKGIAMGWLFTSFSTDRHEVGTWEDCGGAGGPHCANGILLARILTLSHMLSSPVSSKSLGFSWAPLMVPRLFRLQEPYLCLS